MRHGIHHSYFPLLFLFYERKIVPSDFEFELLIQNSFRQQKKTVDPSIHRFSPERIVLHSLHVVQPAAVPLPRLRSLVAHPLHSAVAHPLRSAVADPLPMEENSPEARKALPLDSATHDTAARFCPHWDATCRHRSHLAPCHCLMLAAAGSVVTFSCILKISGHYSAAESVLLATQEVGHHMAVADFYEPLCPFQFSGFTTVLCCFFFSSLAVIGAAHFWWVYVE